MTTVSGGTVSEISYAVELRTGDTGGTLTAGQGGTTSDAGSVAVDATTGAVTVSFNLVGAFAVDVFAIDAMGQRRLVETLSLQVLPTPEFRLRLLATRTYVSQPFDFTLNVGQFDFVWLPARTPHGGAPYVW